MNRSDFNFALDKLRLSPSKVIYLPNGVPDELFMLDKSLECNSIVNNYMPCASKQDILKIVFVGRLWPQKNPTLLVYALGILKDEGIRFSADFLGDGELFDEIVALSNEVGVSGFVKFSGWTPNASQMISSYDVFVLPSRYEGMPLSIIEAMASRTTVIASDVSGNNDLIRHLENGMLFDSDSDRALADCLIALANDRALMESLAKEAFNEASKKYRASTHCSKLLNIYKSC
jgi:glycosyltransferase involved in cell wall biosynthesis